MFLYNYIIQIKASLVDDLQVLSKSAWDKRTSVGGAFNVTNMKYFLFLLIFASLGAFGQNRNQSPTLFFKVLTIEPASKKSVDSNMIVIAPDRFIVRGVEYPVNADSCKPQDWFNKKFWLHLENTENPHIYRIQLRDWRPTEKEPRAFKSVVTFTVKYLQQ